MKSRAYVFGAMVCLAILPVACEEVRAEFSVGVGEIAESTRQASAIFNDALANFHLMMAALDRKDVVLASKYQENAISLLRRASEQYGEASKRADKHVLAPLPKTLQEIADIQYYLTHAQAFGVDARQPVSQRELVEKTADLVSRLADRIKNADVKMNIRQQQALATDAVELQAFLNSVTTVLTLG